MKTFMILFGLIFSIGASAAISPSGVPGYQYGSSVVGSNLPIAPPSIAVTDPSKVFGFHCGFGTSAMTSGNYYKCFRDGGSSSGSDYLTHATKTTYCSGFYMASGSNINTAFSFGYGTAAIGSNNTSTPPTGNVNYSTNGNSIYFGNQPASGLYWVAYPVSFPPNVYPYIQAANTMSLVVNFICQEI